MKKFIPKVKRIFLWSVSGLLFALAMANFWIILTTGNIISNDITSLPQNNVGLVLGTSKRLVGGEDNPYFHSRITAATILFKAGKIKHILVSGDNSTRYYNEPLDMQKALMDNGIPKDAITLDHAGLRTLDSIVRCNKIFQQSSFTVITQKFHAHRALFISEFYEMNAIGFVADSPPLSFSWKVRIRELLARPLAILDLYIFHKQPRFSGEIHPIKIK